MATTREPLKTSRGTKRTISSVGLNTLILQFIKAMSMKTLFYYLGFLFIFLHLSCQSKNKKVENLVTFAKVYGYVKYFHPGDEAAQIDWDKFSIYGASQIDKCKTRKELTETLNRLFNPIAPSVIFSSDGAASDVKLSDIIPDEVENYRVTYWQHRGVSIGMYRQNQPYTSRRINREPGIEGAKLFDYSPEFGESIIKKIGSGIYCRIPVALYCNDQSTLKKRWKQQKIKFPGKLLNK